MRPEQIKAMEYMRDKGTSLAAAQVHERVAAGFAAFEGFLDGVTEAEARAWALPGEWSIQEVADHLVETHRPSLEELRDLLAGRRPPGGPIPAGLQSRDPLARPWPELLGELKSLQAEVVAALGAAPDRLNEARAPVVMVISVKEPDGRETPLHWIEELDWKAYAARKVLHAVRG
jgi:hypothetical protein